MERLSVFITTYNNADTLDKCLSSVAWADEIVVLDSFSTDQSMEIARHHGCKIHQHEFLGYGKQKQMALEKTSNHWVLLLDADEMLSPELQKEIKALLETGPRVAGYALPRREQVFWRMNHPGVRLNYHLRLFDKRRGRLSDTPIHAAPKVDGGVGRLSQPFFHFGERDIHEKVDKINAYSTGLVADKLARGRKAYPLILIIYPPWIFFRSYVLKRAFLDGWAGFIASVVMSFYAFLRYAKLYEHDRRARQDPGEELGAPPDRNAGF